MLSGGLPAAPWGPGPTTPLAPACLRRPRAGKAPGIGKQRLFPLPSPSASPSGLKLFCFKVAFFVFFFFLIFLHLLGSHIFSPKHVPSELHRRYTFLEEMLQSQKVSGVFSLIVIG